MPSDQDESSAVWQNASAMEWETPIVPADQVVPSAPFVDNDSFISASEVDDESQDPDTSDLLATGPQPSLISKEVLGTFARQVSPILIPLPFALIVFLLTLPATLQGWPAHPTPLVMVLILLGLSILQGTLLYFAGSNDTLWLLYIALGYALFIISAAFAIAGPMGALVTLIALVVVGLILSRRSIHPTQEGHVDLVEAFGKYKHTFYPGLNLLMPWEKVTRRLNTQERTWTCGQQRVQTAREQQVQLTATVSYQLLPEDAYLAALRVQDWENNLHTLFVGTVQSVVNELTPGDFVTWTQSLYSRANGDASSFNAATATRWDRINTRLSRRMEDQVASWGVQINWVRIQDITLLPHTPGVHPALASNDNGGTTMLMQPTQAQIQSTPEVSAPAPVQPPKKSAPPTEANRQGAPAKSLPQVEALKDMYNAVRQNNITDPTVILDLAQRFELLASDPVASKTIDFDATRAATTLRQRAQKLQELAQARVKSE